MKEFLLKMTKNISSLILFLNNPKNIDYLNYLNNSLSEDIKILPLKEKIWYFFNDVSVLKKCKCGNNLKFKGFFNGFYLTCGNMECIIDSRRNTSIKNWGYDNPKKSPELNIVIQENILKKYNGKHYMELEEVQNKFNNTMMDNYGVKWAQQSSEINNKSKNTFDNNINKELINDEKSKVLISYTSDPDLNKIRNDNRQLYIINNYIKKLPINIHFIKKINNKNNTDIYLNLRCDKCNDDFKITRLYFNERIKRNIELCLNCNPVKNGRSNGEIEILNYIKEIYNGNILENNKSIIDGELDIYIPELKIAIEYNGLYWHSNVFKEEDYHLNKTNLCNNIGIDLIHIWEDDWIYKKDIIKSIIKHRLGLTNNIIYARKCRLEYINDIEIIKQFNLLNNLYGNKLGDINIGLYYNNKLISLMIILNNKIISYCNLLDTIIIGGFSKMINRFNNLEISCDISKFKGSCLFNFNIIDILVPNMFYINDDKRNNISGKNIIYDCGNKIYKLI